MYTAVDAARQRLVRRLRVHTLELPLAASRAALLASVDPAAMAAALVHKTLRVVAEAGRLWRAWVCLVDWLAALVGQSGAADAPLPQQPPRHALRGVRTG